VDRKPTNDFWMGKRQRFGRRKERRQDKIGGRPVETYPGKAILKWGAKAVKAVWNEWKEGKDLGVANSVDAAMDRVEDLVQSVPGKVGLLGFDASKMYYNIDKTVVMQQVQQILSDVMEKTDMKYVAMDGKREVKVQKEELERGKFGFEIPELMKIVEMELRLCYATLGKGLVVQSQQGVPIGGHFGPILAEISYGYKQWEWKKKKRSVHFGETKVQMFWETLPTNRVKKRDNIQRRRKIPVVTYVDDGVEVMQEGQEAKFQDMKPDSLTMEIEGATVDERKASIQSVQGCHDGEGRHSGKNNHYACPSVLIHHGRKDLGNRKSPLLPSQKKHRLDLDRQSYLCESQLKMEEKPAPAVLTEGKYLDWQDWQAYTKKSVKFLGC